MNKKIKSVIVVISIIAITTAVFYKINSLNKEIVKTNNEIIKINNNYKKLEDKYEEVLKEKEEAVSKDNNASNIETNIDTNNTTNTLPDNLNENIYEGKHCKECGKKTYNFDYCENHKPKIEHGPEEFTLDEAPQPIDDGSNAQPMEYPSEDGF